MPHIIAKSHIYIYNHHPFKGGTYPKCQLHFSRCFWGGPWKCKLTFWRYFWRPSPQKQHLGDVRRPNLRFRGVPKNVSYILVWPPLKSSLKEVDIYTVYIKIFFPSLSLHIMYIYIFICIVQYHIYIFLYILYPHHIPGPSKRQELVLKVKWLLVIPDWWKTARTCFTLSFYCSHSQIKSTTVASGLH